MTAENRYSPKFGHHRGYSSSEAERSPSESRFEDKDCELESESIVPGEEYEEGKQGYLERPCLEDDLGAQENPDYHAPGELQSAQNIKSHCQERFPGEEKKAPLAAVISEDDEVIKEHPGTLEDAEAASFPAQGTPKSYLETPGSQVYGLLESINRSSSPSKSDPGYGIRPSTSARPRGLVSNSMLRIPRKRVEAETYYQRSVHLAAGYKFNSRQYFS